MTSSRIYLDAIQIGRASAALAVTLLHIVKDTDRLYPRYTSFQPQFTSSAAGWHELLAAGVDVFFVISGVVMVLSTQRTATTAVPASSAGGRGWQAAAVGDFIYRRFARIFPLYWLLTLIYIAALALLPQLFQENTLDVSHAIGSFFLIPTIGPDGVAFPLIYAGWTLTYELLFYTLFAVSLWLAAGWRASAVCIALVLCWHTLHYTSLADTTAMFRSTENVLLEFIFGVLLANWWLRQPFDRRLAMPLIIVGILLLLLGTATAAELPRFLLWGIPSALIVAGLMCWQPGSSLINRTLIHLGAASYSLYLFHFFALRVYFMLLGKTGLLNLIPPAVGMLLALLFAVISSVIVYHVVEQTLLKLTRRLQPAFLRPKRAVA